MYDNRSTVKAVVSGTGSSAKLINQKLTGRPITFHCSISDGMIVSYCFTYNIYTPCYVCSGEKGTERAVWKTR